MLEDIKLVRIPKEAGVYLFKVDNEVIYIGSSNNLYRRLKNHRIYIRKGSNHGHKQELYQYLQSNPFAVEFQLTNDYRQLEQSLVEKYNPRYNSRRAFTGLGAKKGREAEYEKERYQKYKEEILEHNKQYYESNKEEKKKYNKQYYESNKEEIKQHKKQYNNQLCCYNGEVLTLNALSKRFIRAGIPNPTAEAKKYLI